MKEENGPLIALIVFVVLSIVCGVFAWLRYSDLMGPDPSGQQSKDKEIENLQKEIRDFEGKIANYEAKRDRMLELIRAAQTEYEWNCNEFEAYGTEYERRRKLVEWAEGFEKQASELSGTVNKLKSDTLTKVKKETTDVREQMEKTLQDKTQAKEAAIGRTRQVTEDFKVDEKKFRAQKNYEVSGLDDSKSVLTDLTQREIERATVLNETDGHVVLADLINNVVVLDIGTAVGVRNGYRFEVYTIRPGNQRVTKGYVEVRRADASKSECIIVRKPVALPKDPLSDYVASQPEEVFSPRQSSGQKGASAQPLSGTPKIVMMGVNKDDPILEGDRVQNPFFAPGKSLTFYIAGAKEIVNEQQKSAIRYKWTEIKAVAEFYGAKVLPAVDVNINYVIAQKNPKTEGTDAEKAEFQKAVDLGLPVIYEWELFRFLDTK